MGPAALLAQRERALVRPRRTTSIRRSDVEDARSGTQPAQLEFAVRIRFLTAAVDALPDG